MDSPCLHAACPCQNFDKETIANARAFACGHSVPMRFMADPRVEICLPAEPVPGFTAAFQHEWLQENAWCTVCPAVSYIGALPPHVAEVVIDAE
jgi:hypothetical protein